MKNLILYCLIPILFFAACKKDIRVNPITPIKTNAIVLASDSGSYTIDGKTYALDTQGGIEIGNTDADRKLDSIIDQNHYYISGRKDSIFFYRTFNLYNSQSKQSIDISFFKKYAVKNMIPAPIYYPQSQADLFQAGSYQYGTDYTRENATNGVALAVNGIGQTYSNNILGMPSTVPAKAENNASFEITSFKKVDGSQYLLEAKFNVVIFDDSGTAKQVKDGYVRLNINIGQ
jgi:hypothetical protein